MISIKEMKLSFLNSKFLGHAQKGAQKVAHRCGRPSGHSETSKCLEGLAFESGSVPAQKPDFSLSTSGGLDRKKSGFWAGTMWLIRRREVRLDRGLVSVVVVMFSLLNFININNNNNNSLVLDKEDRSLIHSLDLVRGEGEVWG